MNSSWAWLGKRVLTAFLLGSCGSFLIACASPRQNGQPQITVAAAASLSDALTEVGESLATNHPHITIDFNFAASGTLQRQIEQGSPADVFASAANQQMDALAEQNLLLAGSRQRFARNQVVVVATANSDLDIDELTDLD